MKILSIETSCDDTGIAIVEASGDKNPSFNVLSNIVSSQIEIHKKYGGVYPMMAKREHQKNLTPVLKSALAKAKLLKISKCKCQNSNAEKLKNILEREPELFKKILPFLEKYEKPDIDLISITIGPGLEPCLWAGINFAKALSYYWNIPIIPVNHIESHILANFLKNKIYFPAVCLVVSGGHTQIILMEKIGKYKILGETKDDAAGECFDKCAKVLGLGYPGGPIISKLAEKEKKSLSLFLPRPMIGTKDYDFSFSGLKTAVLYKVKSEKSKIKDKKYIKEMSKEIQQAIIDVLIKKTIKAAKDYHTKTIILGGGVSANKELRKQLEEKAKKAMPYAFLLFPDASLSVDNGLMGAITGFFHQKSKLSLKESQKIEAEANLRIGKTKIL